MGLLSLHNHMSQYLLIINVFLDRDTETDRGRDERERKRETMRDILIVLFLCRPLNNTEWAEKEGCAAQKQEANLTSLWSPVHTALCGPRHPSMGWMKMVSLSDMLSPSHLHTLPRAEVRQLHPLPTPYLLAWWHLRPLFLPAGRTSSTNPNATIFLQDRFNSNLLRDT